MREGREELRAAIEARRELGPELEPELVDGFVERIERRIDDEIERRLRRTVVKRSDDRSFALALISLGVSIPLSAIAISESGLLALLIVWAGLVLLNWAYARRA